MRSLRFNGTNSGDDGCPSVHEDLKSGEIIIHGPQLTDPEDIAQLRRLGEGEIPIVIPRELLIDWGPKEIKRVPRIIDIEAFEHLFTTFEHTAWRLETRQRYAADEATGTYAQFMRGEPVVWDYETPWAQHRRALATAGKQVSRVRVIDNPPTMGQRYLLSNAARNAALGEDVRNVWRADVSLPAEDFWFFDSRLVAVLNFDDDDQLIDVELITEPAAVVRYAQLRDAACHHAIPFEHVAAKVTATE